MSEGQTNYLDAAPFARVESWNPDRTEGSASSVVEEYRAEDVFPGEALFRDGAGVYRPSVTPDGRASIALAWPSRRTITIAEILLAPEAGAIPCDDGIGVEFWEGYSAWQGKWTPLKGRLEQTDARVWRFTVEGPGQVTQKIRWQLSGLDSSFAVKELSARTPSPMTTAELVVLSENQPCGCVEVGIVNGAIAESGDWTLSRKWDMSGELRLLVRATTRTEDSYTKADQTMLLFRIPQEAFAVGVDDVLLRGPVYVARLGIFISESPLEESLAERKKLIASRKTVLEEVRSMPDQTREQAMARTHMARMDVGPIMLSLACDNEKFLLGREGQITYHDNFTVNIIPEGGGFPQPTPPLYRIDTLLGDSPQKDKTIQRRLEEGWLPAPVTVTDIDGVRYTQRTYVVPAGETDAPFQIGAKPLAVLEVTVENLESHVAQAAVRFPFIPGTLASAGIAMAVDNEKRSTRVVSGSRVVGVVDAAGVDGGTIDADGATWSWQSDLPANFRGRLYLCLPAWVMTTGEEERLPAASDLFGRFQRYWDGIMSGAMQIRTPDEWLNNVVRANQVHIYMAARNENNGERVAPWISSLFYDHAFDSEGNSVVRGMVKMGHFEFARRAFDFFFSHYKPEGFMTTGYTLHGNGWHLRTLAEYMRYSEDGDWFRVRAHYPLTICAWIMAQREKTKKTLANGGRALEWGLMPPGRTADWGTIAYYFYCEGQYCSGIRDMGGVLCAMGYDEGRKILANYSEHRREIERAFRYAQSNAPVVPLRNGAWVPFHPIAMEVPGQVGDLYRSFGDQYLQSWRYDVELGAQHLGYFGIIEANDCRITDMLEYMEDDQFLRDGADCYAAAENHADWFNMGGFGKLQPYYGQIPELYASRDDVKPFLRSYFNTLASLVSTEVLSIYEGFTPFCFNKTHETGYFLAQTRDMLVAERGENLWLAPMIPTNWLEDGLEVEVKNAPTPFGPVSYRIRSRVGSGCIEAEIEPPARSRPKEIVLCLRHPEGKAIRSVEVSDGSVAEIENGKEMVRLKPSRSTMGVKVVYE